MNPSLLQPCTVRETAAAAEPLQPSHRSCQLLSRPGPTCDTDKSVHSEVMLCSTVSDWSLRVADCRVRARTLLHTAEFTSDINTEDEEDLGKRPVRCVFSYYFSKCFEYYYYFS